MNMNMNYINNMSMNYMNIMKYLTIINIEGETETNRGGNFKLQFGSVDLS
jgi:hypothetical protein